MSPLALITLIYITALSRADEAGRVRRRRPGHNGQRTRPGSNGQRRRKQRLPDFGAAVSRNSPDYAPRSQGTTRRIAQSVGTPVAALPEKYGRRPATATATRGALRAPEAWAAAENSLPASEAWAAARTLCDGAVDRPRRPQLVFVHIFKAAGSTTRATLQAWSQLPRNTTCNFVEAGKCGRGQGRARAKARGVICAHNGRVRVTPALDIVAGHVWYGTFGTPRPAIYVTCVREPRAQRVSGQLYVYRKRYGNMTLAAAAGAISGTFEASRGFYVNTVKRLGAALELNDRDPPEALLAASAARMAAALDETFAIVGPTERYATFYALLAKLLPGAPASFWMREAARRENPSAHSSAAVLGLLSPRATSELNRTLRYEKVVYDAAVVVHDKRCAAYLYSRA